MAPENLADFDSVLEEMTHRFMTEELPASEGEAVLYQKFKELSSRLVMRLFLGLEGPEAEEMAGHATTHWHGIISVPLNVKLSFLMSSGYRRALEAKERLLEIIEAKIRSNQCPFLKEFMQKTDCDMEVVKNHVLVFACALIPKVETVMIRNDSRTDSIH